MAWLIALSPMYFLYTYFDYLSQNSWGVRLNARSMQLVCVILLVVVIGLIMSSIIYRIFYEYVLINNSGSKAKTVKKGRGILSNVFNRRYKTYIDSGRTYFIDNKIKWHNAKGKEIGRIGWLDEEIEKERVLKRIR